MGLLSREIKKEIAELFEYRPTQESVNKVQPSLHSECNGYKWIMVQRCGVMHAGG